MSAERTASWEVDELGQRRQRRSRNWRIAIIAVAVVLPFGLIALFMTTDIRLPDLDATPFPTPIRVLGYVLQAASLVIVIIALVGVHRARLWGQAWRSPLAAMSFSEQRRILRAIRRQQPVEEKYAGAAPVIARDMTRQRPHVLLLTGGTFTVVGQALYGESAFQRWLALIATGCSVYGLARLTADRRLGFGWLSRHDAPSQRPGSGRPGS